MRKRYGERERERERERVNKRDQEAITTGFFDRNVFFKLLIFQPKNQYFSETKYVLNRLLLDILKIKCSLHNMNKENCEIN